VLNHNPYVVVLRRGIKIAKVIGLTASVSAITKYLDTHIIPDRHRSDYKLSKTEQEDF